MQTPSALRYKNPDNDPRGPYILTDVTSPSTPEQRPSLRYEVHGHLPPAGRTWRFTSQRLQQLIEDGRIVFGRDGTGRPTLKRYLDELSRPVEPEEPPPKQVSLEFLVRSTMRGIAEAIARNPSCLRDVEWRDLERALREVFERLGFDTELTRPAMDGGFDLRLTCSDPSGRRTFLVEVKHWLPSGAKPGRRILAAFFDVVARSGDRTTGVLLSSSGFAQNAVTGRTEVEQHRVRIAGRSKIVSLCHHYVQVNEGLWLPTSELGDLLLEGTS